MDDKDAFVSHKFKPLNDYCWESLKSSSFYFAEPGELNDPADCQIDLAKAFRIARPIPAVDYSEKMAMRYLSFIEEVNARAKTCGVFSLCSGDIVGNKQRLMWAHYAANHTGICMTFRIPETFVIEQLIGCAPVQYSSEQLFDALRRLDMTREPDFDTELKPIIAAFLTTKSPEWDYEMESRLIADKPGPQAFDRSWLQQICFGLRTSAEDRQRVTELADTYPNCSLVEAAPSDDDLFRLVLREV